MLTSQKIIKLLKLKPLPGEGGFYRETYRSALPVELGFGIKRSLGTSIYYLITPERFSTLHRVCSDEVLHFYLGDPVEMLLLYPGGRSRTVVLGPDIEKGQHPQFLVPKNTWQGSRLKKGGRFALLGTTVFPGFDFADYRQGNRKILLKRYPKCKPSITALTIE
ncbi:cupin domain-containing protein [candidate division TA06 bacterium]|uniref:Cupin domain-containing protein n=1 Tax=candidate division TA06 bacterium TaxID=2250710 RepID=A0A933MK66_UNCT6|nr:cupin domain-containing protein [candidate division TA06 bacterium]